MKKWGPKNLYRIKLEKFLRNFEPFSEHKNLYDLLLLWQSLKYFPGKLSRSTKRTVSLNNNRRV